MSRYIRYIHITDNVPENWDKIIKVAKSSYKYYWYIFHDKDKDENGTLKKKHLHLICYDSSPATINKALSNFKGTTLDNCIEGCRSGRAMIRYLIHKDDTDKFQYSPQEVTSNNMTQFYSAIEDSDNVVSLFNSYEELRVGKISVGEFIQRYKEQLSSMNFYQQLSTFNLLHKPTKHYLIDEKEYQTDTKN